MKEVILTAEGYKKLQQEIDLLRGDKRREVAERIRIAREFGDIAENAEYDDAKNEQAMLEHKIAQLEERLLSARVITKKEISKDTVSIGSHVRIKDMEKGGKTFEYRIVGSAETNPTEKQSKLGKAALKRIELQTKTKEREELMERTHALRGGRAGEYSLLAPVMSSEERGKVRPIWTVLSSGFKSDLQGKAGAPPDQRSVRSGDYDLIYVLREDERG